MGFIVELSFYGIAGAAHAMRRLVRVFRVGISTLNHETWDNAMKDRSVIKSFSCKFDKVIHMPRRSLGKEFELDIPEFCFDNRFRVSHPFYLLFRKIFLFHLSMRNQCV